VDDQRGTPFDSIENAREYFRLLAEMLEETEREVEKDIAAEAESKLPRRLDAFRLVQFKLRKLRDHAKSSSLLLNDLRTLRRLLLQERAERREAKEAEKAESGS